MYRFITDNKSQIIGRNGKKTGCRSWTGKTKSYNVKKIDSHSSL